MNLIKTAIDSRVPMISVRTDDILYVAEILSVISGAEVTAFDPAEATSNKTMAKGSVCYFAAAEEVPPNIIKQIYLKARMSKSCVVCINPAKPSVLVADMGVMVAPKVILQETIQKAAKITAEEASIACNAFGGLSLREAYDLVCIRNKFWPDEASPDRFARIRQEMNCGALRGLTFVSTEEEFYEPPTVFANWIEANAAFFVEAKYPNLIPRGLLLGGTPGTGKTSGAKYLARRFGVPLLRLDLAGMKGKYVGESEAALSASLAALDQIEPCVVLIDEVEKFFTHNTTDSKDSGVSSGLLGALLWWLQEHKTRVFTIMTTNKVAALPKELYRPGRIDEAHTFIGLQTESAINAFLTRSFESEATRTWGGIPPDAETAFAAFKAEYVEGAKSTDQVPQADLVEAVTKFIKRFIIEEASK